MLLVLPGLALALLGSALALDIISLRLLVQALDINTAIGPVAQLRHWLGHNMAQVIEGASALVGLGLFGWAARAVYLRVRPYKE